MTVLVDHDGLVVFSTDALLAVRRAHDDLDDARSALADLPTEGRTPLLRRVLADIDDLLGELARLLAQPAHLAAAFACLDDTMAADRHLAAAVAAIGDRSGHPADRALVATLTDLPPAAVAALWANLSVADRHRVTTRWPDAVRSLPGIPLDVRDAGNRALIRAVLADLHTALRRPRTGPSALTGDAPWDPDPGRTALQVRIDRLEVLLAADLVLDVDPTGDGRGVVAFGDPTNDRHVATIVPGVATTLATMPRLATEARTLRAAARTVDDRVATIAWLGYDAPPGIVGIGAGLATHDVTNLVLAATPVAGELHQQALVDHAAGLRAVNPDVHHTVVGHSYGAVLAFRALKPGGTDAPLDVDDVVALGAPGAGHDVDSLDDLAVRRGIGIWSATSALDPIPRLPGVLGPAIPALGDEVRVLPTDRANGGHSRYFAPGSAAVRAMAVVVAGRPTRAPSRLSEVAHRDRHPDRPTVQRR